MVKHLSENDIDKLIEQEPDISIRGYLDMLNELHRYIPVTRGDSGRAEVQEKVESYKE